MPRGNGTGPMGMGRMTGRGMGNCAGFVSAGYPNHTGFGYGFGRRCGPGRGFCATGVPGRACFGYRAYAGITEAAISEKAFLSNQAAFFENQLQQVKLRLESFKKETE